MRQLAKAAAAAAVIASVSFIATGTATTAASAATAPRAVMHRGGECIDILGNVGIGNGILGNLLNGEGNPGAQVTDCG